VSFPRHPPAAYRHTAGVRERLCGGCGRWLPHDRQHFYAHATKPHGLQSQCIGCIGSKARAHSQRKSAAQTQARQYARAAIEGRVNA
jgi:hypothetical protein